MVNGICWHCGMTTIGSDGNSTMRVQLKTKTFLERAAYQLLKQFAEEGTDRNSIEDREDLIEKWRCVAVREPVATRASAATGALGWSARRP